MEATNAEFIEALLRAAGTIELNTSMPDIINNDREFLGLGYPTNEQLAKWYQAGQPYITVDRYKLKLYILLTTIDLHNTRKFQEYHPNNIFSSLPMK